MFSFFARLRKSEMFILCGIGPRIDSSPRDSSFGSIFRSTQLQRRQRLSGAQHDIQPKHSNMAMHKGAVNHHIGAMLRQHYGHFPGNITAILWQHSGNIAAIFGQYYGNAMVLWSHFGMAMFSHPKFLSTYSSVHF